MNEYSNLSDSEALRTVLAIVENLSPDARDRVLRTINAFFGVEAVGPKIAHSSPTAAPHPAPNSFSEDRAPSVKIFLNGKKPTTDVEKVACLAYFLAHYRGTEDFKTVDISLLNTEAGQIKFSNAANAVANAEKSGFLIPSARGQKRISAAGELYVQALPDRVAAREAMSSSRSRRRKQ